MRFCIDTFVKVIIDNKNTFVKVKQNPKADCRIGKRLFG